MCKKFIKILFFFTLIFSSNLKASIDNKIIAKIGDEIITGFDVENKIKTNLYLSGQKINQENVNKIKVETLNSLINLKLKSNEIKKHNIPTNAQAINQYINSIASNLDISKFDLIKQFEINNIDYAQFLKDIEVEFLWQRLVAKIYLDKIKVDDNQIELELREIVKKEKKNQSIEEINLSEIEVIVKNIEEEKKLIKNITDIINSAGFEEAAIKFSNSLTAKIGGNLGWVRSDQISDKVYNVIRNLEIGEISKSLKQGKILTLFKINEKRFIKSNKEINTENIKISLENKMKNDLLNLYSKSHLSKIKNITFIEFL